jgi:hypothetical protein
LTRDAFKDEEVVDRDVIHDSVEDDEEEVWLYVLVTICEIKVIEQDNGEGKQDVRIGVTTTTEIIHDNEECPCRASIMAARDVREHNWRRKTKSKKRKIKEYKSENKNMEQSSVTGILSEKREHWCRE